MTSLLQKRPAKTKITKLVDYSDDEENEEEAKLEEETFQQKNNMQNILSQVNKIIKGESQDQQTNLLK